MSFLSFIKVGRIVVRVTYKRIFFAISLGFSAVHFMGTPVEALDGIMTEEQDPFASFKLGVSAYKSGDKDEALRALALAAEQGHIGAKWKLARMYADGDGVHGDDSQAYEMFLKVVGAGSDGQSYNEAYIADALVALGLYNRRGITSADMTANPNKAREFYIRAAVNYSHPVAQYELGRMLLTGEGGAADPLQAARWFQLSARKGHAGAQAMLGHMLFQAGQEVRGLALMTMAYERANLKDKVWIGPMQERSFAIVGEIERRSAISMANDLVIQGISK